ncbi:YceI family protein [Cognatishimia sp.]|uniref:YceI family protein n=1 Tax=Cognatishimia sp. TaxID=2211648 RepID=UPI003BAD8D80
MKYHRRSLILSAISFGLAHAAHVAQAAAVRYRLDKDKSRVRFQFKFNGAAGAGFIPIEDANVSLDLNQVHRSSVDVTLSIKKARTGDVFATTAMKSAEVLNANQFPTARFVSRNIKQQGQMVEILGDLTLRGVTRPVSVDARIIREPDAPKDNSRLVLEITGAVNRSTFGATGYSNLVGDQIDLKFYVWINRAAG